VLRQEHREVPAFATSEPAVLAKQQPLLAAHSLAELPTASPELALANFIDSLGQVALDVEPVEHDVGLWRVRLDRADERLRHVHRDRNQLARPLAAELREEAIDGLAVLAAPDPHDTAALVAPDDGQVLVLPAPVADLVDADVAKRPLELARRGLLDPALDEPHHAGPVQPELAAHARDRRIARSRENLGLERVREPRPRPRPRHLLDANPAVPAADATQLAADVRRYSPCVQVPPLSGRLDVVDPRLGLVAARANRGRARW